MSKI
jgi:hypothetical protein